jgi:IS30 family transposase
MAKAGNTWHLTPKRREFIIGELTAQMSVPSIALELGLSDDTLYRKLKEADIDHRAIKKRGLEKLRRSCLGWIYNIEDDKDRTEVAMKYLNKYLPADEAETTKVEVDISGAVQSVLEDLK